MCVCVRLDQQNSKASKKDIKPETAIIIPFARAKDPQLLLPFCASGTVNICHKSHNTNVSSPKQTHPSIYLSASKRERYYKAEKEEKTKSVNSTITTVLACVSTSKDYISHTCSAGTCFSTTALWAFSFS